MEEGDTLVIRFDTAGEARFERFPGGKSEGDTGWTTARDIVLGMSGKIL